MEIPLLQIDAFASQAFKGNPAVVLASAHALWETDRLAGDRVFLSGEAVTVLRGSLLC